MTSLRSRRALRTAALALGLSFGLAACAPAAPAPAPGASDAAGDLASDVVETGGPRARIALAYDGGVLVLDAATLEVVGDLPLPGFNHLSDAGDGRHVLVATQGGWAALDAGVWTEPHGDHTHSYATAPTLTDVLLPAEKPGHAVVHDGLVTFFDDATGTITVVPANGWTEAASAGAVTPTLTANATQAHHGVAVGTADGHVFMTEGTPESRSGVRLVDAQGNVVAQSADCPGVHGEATYGDGDFAVGCQGGVLLLDGHEFQKVTVPDPEGAVGTLYPVEGSNVLLTDYKAAPREGTGRTQVALVDTATGQLQIVTIDAEYTWRGLARGGDGSALVYGTDGALRVLDPATGQEQRRIQVGAAWSAPAQWQSAHPAIAEHRGFVYVTDPDGKQLHVVDPVTGKVVQSASLPHAPVELAVVSG